MKKQYKKPLVVVERFSIVHTAARDCWNSIPQDQVNFNNHTCGWEIAFGTILFNTSIVDSTCNMNGDDFSEVCYNNPGEGQYMFRS